MDYTDNVFLLFVGKEITVDNNPLNKNIVIFMIYNEMLITWD